MNQKGTIALITPHLQGLHHGQRKVSNFPRREKVLFSHGSSGGREFGDDGIEKVRGRGGGSGELRFQSFRVGDREKRRDRLCRRFWHDTQTPARNGKTAKPASEF